MDILILDATHGADVLAAGYVARGHTATCVDVYRKAEPGAVAAIRACGARLCETVPSEHFDLVVMPCHCPDRFLEPCTYDRRIFFSEAVGDLIDDGRFRIEVTGAKGKTGACYLLAAVLSAAGRKVFLHTSRGQGPWEDGHHAIEAWRSIAPTSLLTLPDGDYDVMVCEVSLGGSGRADIACITNLRDDYGIAAGTRRASEAKAAVLGDGINIVPADERGFWEGHGKPCVGYGGAVEPVAAPRFGEPLRAVLHYGGDTPIALRGDYLATTYLEAMDLAVAVCGALDVPREAVVRGLESFGGVPGRGEVSVGDGRVRVTERNPGISAASVAWTLGALDRMGMLANAVALVDPVDRKVCDKMDADGIAAVAAGYGVPVLFTSGDGVRPAVPHGRDVVIEFIKEGYR